MTEREQSVFNYWYLNGWTSKYEDEADLLFDTLKMLGMLHNIQIIRSSSSIHSGRADVIVCYRGRFVAIELKDRTGITSAPQKKFLTETLAAGGIAAECRTLSEVWKTLMQC